MPRVIAPSDRSIDHPDSAAALCCVASAIASAYTTLPLSMHRRFCDENKEERVWLARWFPGLDTSHSRAHLWKYAGMHEHLQPGVWWYLVNFFCLWVVIVSEDPLYGCKKLCIHHSLPVPSLIAWLYFCCSLESRSFSRVYAEVVFFSRIRSFTSSVFFFMNQCNIGAKTSVT